MEHIWRDYSSGETGQKSAPDGMERAQKWPILVQMRFFLGIRGPRDPRGMVKVGQMVDHSETCVGELP